MAGWVISAAPSIGLGRTRPCQWMLVGSGKPLRTLTRTRQGKLLAGVCAGLGRRCEAVGGDFFESVPAGGDAYILKTIIHDWDEERALAGLLPFLASLVEEASGEDRPQSLRVRAEILGMAIDDFAETLRTRLHIPGDTTEATLEHYQSEHAGTGGR